jgi:hypothetical protein
MEGTSEPAERGSSPFKPQTVLLRQMPSVGQTTPGGGRDYWAGLVRRLYVRRESDRAQYSECCD